MRPHRRVAVEHAAAWGIDWKFIVHDVSRHAMQNNRLSNAQARTHALDTTMLRSHMVLLFLMCRLPAYPSAVAAGEVLSLLCELGHPFARMWRQRGRKEVHVVRGNAIKICMYALLQR